MRKFLIVGCGGSGGATLAYMMDQLRSELSLHGVDRIPAGWQFVHIDVPVTDVREAPGLGSVRELGGSYYGTGAKGIGYKEIDAGVSQSLQQSNALDAIATWAPRKPQEVLVSVSEGAGQYRAIGRMITLSKPAGVRQALEEGWNRLARVETDTEMSALPSVVPGLGTFDANDPPIVLVVSSMAGGAGASMAIDVCRLLTLIPGLQPELMGVFMVSADIFDSLPDTARTGVRANALAMLGEIVATQAGAAREHDVATLAALGHQNGAGARIPFQRVFPVGRFVGAQRTQFGDGTPQAVYRGLGRGLAAMISSGTATNQFVRYDLTNTLSPAGDRDQLGWGEQWDPLPWGSFGFASLSMGRERYREYSAQRLARTSVDRLLHGHMQSGSSATSLQQIGVLLDSQWSQVTSDLGLPGPTADGKPIPAAKMYDWFITTAFPRTEVDNGARALVESEVASYMPSPAGIKPAQWLPVLRQKLTERKAAVAAGASQAAHRWAYSWQQQFTQRVVDVTSSAVSTFGIPYATAMLDRLEGHLKNVVVPVLHELSIRGPKELTSVPQAFETELSGVRGELTDGAGIMDKLTAGFRAVFRDGLTAQSAGLAEGLLANSAAGLLSPLKEALREGQKELELAEASDAKHLGLAHLETDIYGAWPSDGDQQVNERFDVANNEVLITRSATFPAQYEADVTASVDGSNFATARTTAVTQVVGGTWKTAGATQAHGGLITQDAPWRSAVFAVNPATNEVEVPSKATFAVHVSPADVLGRARLFVLRPGESFDQFCNLSLRDYVLSSNVPQSELQARQSDVAAKFREALALARPLISVSPTAVQALHGSEMVYRYKFSVVPFAQVPTLTAEFATALGAPSIDASSVTNLETAMDQNQGVTRVDIFGSYPNYSPLAFDSILEPVSKEWGALRTEGRGPFWRWRRSRPLPAALPMGDVERRAMVAGWFVGQITGRIRLPEPPYGNPVEIWNPETARWQAFPNPLLTPPTSDGFASYDWLPAVLESILIAYARAHEEPVMESLRPYRLLRSLFDASTQDPAAGLLERSAQSNLAAWLAEGVTGTGAPSRVPGLAEGQSVDERAELVRGWLSGIRDLAGREFLAPGTHGAIGGGAFSVIATRAQASKTPIFHDLAGDIYLQTDTLLGILARARDAAAAGPAAPAAATPSRPAARPEEYKLPEGGVF